MKIFRILTIALTAALTTSCGDMLDDIHQYIDKGETIYVGKVDSLRVYPGNERIEVRGDLRYGLTQTKCVLSWLHPSGEAENRTIDIVRQGPDDYISVLLEDMQEGPYEFTAITYDDLGNSSIPVTVNGYVYGELYANSLINRSIEGNIVTSYDNGEFLATIKWLPLNYEDALGTYLKYELADGSGTETIFIETDETESVLSGAKPGGDFEWYTSYKPDSVAIDLFQTEKSLQQSTTQYKIPVMNAGNPFEYDERGLAVHGRFGYVKNWTANATAEANGTFDTYGGRNSLSLWTWGGYSPVASIEDGKIYQQITLPAGNYRFDVQLDSYSIGGGSTYEVYAAVATGFADGLPNTEEIAQAIASAKIPDNLNNNALSIEFTLDAPAEVSFGFVGDLGDQSDMNVKWVELWGI